MAGTFSRYRIQFVGAGGEVLQKRWAVRRRTTFKGDEGYVRARVLESNGRMAWDQPVIVK